MQLFVFLWHVITSEKQRIYTNHGVCVRAYMCVRGEASTDPGIIIMKYSTVQFPYALWLTNPGQRVHIWV